MKNKIKKQVDWSLYLVTDQFITKRPNFQDWIISTIQSGVTAVQLREKNVSTRSFVALARQLKTTLSFFSIPLIINDRLDIALACDADGLHIGQSDLSYCDARRLLGPDKIIGLSVETLEQVREAQQFDVDYLAVSPVFPTSTKNDFNHFWGLEGFKIAHQHSRHQLIGIGGINLNNAAEVMRSGASGVAVISAISKSNCPQETTRQLQQEIQKGKNDYFNLR